MARVDFYLTEGVSFVEYSKTGTKFCMTVKRKF